MGRFNMKNISTICLGISMLLCTFDATAGGVTLNRYVASETVEDGFYMSRPQDQGHLRFGVSLHLDYANDPLVLEGDQGERDSESAQVVAHQLTSHLNVALGLWKRLTIFTGFGANLLMVGDDWTNPQTGETVNTADGTGIGDWHLGIRGRLLGEPDDVVGLALQGNLIFPLGGAANDDQNYSGESFLSFVPEILFELRPGPVAINLNLGTQIREDADLGTAAVKDELLYALGLIVPLIDEKLDAHLEFFGAATFADFGDRESTTLEGLAGLKTYLGKKWALGFSMGMGFTRGVGSPDLRAVAMVGYVMPEAAIPEPEPEPEKDTDGDGLLDSQDACPTEPEDKDQFEDENGCPDPDNDQDGVLDVKDECPMEPEDKDGFEDENGCPDPDNDQDEILDEKDQCPNEPEDPDGFEGEDGCPDPDNDQDTVLDVDDKCPLSPGVPEEQGCPKKIRLDISSGTIQILERVEFATGKDVILDRSMPVLQEVYDVVNANKQIKLIRVEGHTDSRGRDKSNMNLSMRRSLSVKRWLVNAGLSSDRLTPYGCGENLPVDTNRTKAGRQTNRRVEFHILDPEPTNGARSTGDQCQPAE